LGKTKIVPQVLEHVRHNGVFLLSGDFQKSAQVVQL